ncbi:MAG: transporter substrate-binding domain-containing protein [Firmicutes bacterium]|nr:transporter substrate-binding domain-containing protein [Bacillota bacterium]
MKKFRHFGEVVLTAAVSAALLAGCGSSAAPAAGTESAKAAAVERTGETASGGQIGKEAAAGQTRLDKILAEGKITNVCEPYFAPYEFIDNTKSGQDQFRGADMELARYIAKDLGVELEIVPLEWSAVLTGVTEGKYDMACAGLGYTEERAKTMNLSDIYQQGSKQGLLIRAEDADKYKTFDDFKGKKVGFQSGTIQETLATQQLPESELVTYDLINNAVLALDAGKVDAVSVAIPNGEMFAKSNPKLAVFEGQYFERGKNGNCIGLPKGETALRDRINAIIAEVTEKGLYQQWLDEAVTEAKALGLDVN